MSAPSAGPKEVSRVLTPEASLRKATAGLVAPAVAWTVLGRFGIVAVLVGLFDIALAWYPFLGGNAAWEFGIINLTVWSLPFPTTGLVLLLASGIALGARWQIRLAAFSMLVLALLILGCMILYALAVPVALQGAPAEVQLNVRKSIIKTVVLGLAFPTLYIALAIAALRQRRSGDS
jgi:hypothetical protein